MCSEFNVQRLTIRSALDILVREGYIYASPKRGYFVAQPRIVQSVRQLTKNWAQSSYQSSYKSDVTEFKRMPADLKLADKLLLPEGNYIYKAVKVYFEDEHPLFIDTAYIPCDI